MRRARVVATLIAASTILAPGLSRASHDRPLPLERHDVVTKEFTLPAGADRSVLVDNVFGAVTVRAGSGDRVTVEIRREVRGHDETELRQGFDEVSFESRADGGRLELGQAGPFRCGHWGSGRRGWGSCDWDADYEVNWEWQVTLPAGVDLVVRTVNDGNLVVEGVRGRVEATNVNGAIRLTGLVGAVTAKTVNGEVRVDYAKSPESGGSFETVNGAIDLTFPAATAADLGFETMNGEIYTDFDVTAVPQRAQAVADSDHRRRYRLENDTLVRIGAGGPRFDCKTLNGDIVVRAR